MEDQKCTYISTRACTNKLMKFGRLIQPRNTLNHTPGVNNNIAF